MFARNAKRFLVLALAVLMIASLCVCFVTAEEESATVGEEVVVFVGTDGDVMTTSIDSDSDAEEGEEEALSDEEEADAYGSIFFKTVLSLLPPLVAIILALITKEVYSSLFVGILTGGVLLAFGPDGFSFENVFNSVVQDGFISSLSDSWNVGIIVFLVLLGTLVVLMNRAGGSRAFGNWARNRIKSRKGAMLSTFVLGVLIFIDDYFNCLTVGSVMRPVTDSHKISRAKLAYLIDATAAPICIIAPISSWAAAVSGMVNDIEGMGAIEIFVRTIPYNLYALLTIAMVICISAMGLDFGPMKRHEENALNGDLFTSGKDEIAKEEEQVVNEKGKTIDLIIPVVILIAFCILGMIYTGGFFSGESLILAFSNCDASYGLALGAIAALIADMIYFIARGVLSFKDCMKAFPDGFKAMVPSIMILTFAWTLNGITGMLGAKFFVRGIVENTAVQFILPALFFLVAVGLSFATGTSWGTFGILIPIVTAIIPEAASDVSEFFIICMSACLAGAVCGDHCSPISDTTIMASAGAQSNHINHVSMQLPYAMLVAGISLVTYLLAGIEALRHAYIILPIGLVLLLAALFGIRIFSSKKNPGKN